MWQSIERVTLKGISIMQKLKDWEPSAWDSKSNYMGDRSHFEWYVVPVMYIPNEGSILSESNWITAKKILDADNVEGVETHKFGHWVCGSYYLILIDPSNKKAVKAGEDIEKSLSNYPVLDEMHYSELESTAISEAWESWGWGDLNQLLAERLGFPETNEISTNSWQLVELLETGNPLMVSEDTNIYFQSDAAKELLEQIPVTTLWNYVTDIELSKDEFDSLPHAVYHIIHTKNINVKDSETLELFTVPYFIAVQYNEKQLKIGE